MKRRVEWRGLPQPELGYGRIYATQYLRPSGRRVVTVIDRPTAISDPANRILAQPGYSLDIEVLSTGEVSMTIEREVEREHEVLAHEIVPNGPGVEEAVDRLVMTAICVVGT